MIVELMNVKFGTKTTLNCLKYRKRPFSIEKLPRLTGLLLAYWERLRQVILASVG